MIHVQYFTFNPFQENSYILYDDTRECVLIDPGCYAPAEEKILADFIAKNNLKPVRLINTHCHIDHVLGVGFVVNKYGLQLEAHKEEEYWVNNAAKRAAAYGFDIPEVPRITKYINEGDVITFGNSSLSVLYTPGHSAGSVTFVASQQQPQFVISGDVLFRGSIGRTDLYGGNFDVLIQSIKSKLLTLPADTLVYSGHGDVTTIQHEARTNPFLQ